MLRVFLFLLLVLFRTKNMLQILLMPEIAYPPNGQEL